jgi:tetratricopeptide (TPR) repeat protein
VQTIRSVVPLVAAMLVITMTTPVCGRAQQAPLQGAAETIQLSPATSSRYEEAVRLAQQCQYALALRALSDVTQAEPDFAPAYHLRGDIYHRLFHYEDSIAQYSQAIKLDPGNSLYLADRGIAWMGPDKYVEARKDFDKALSMDPKCSRAIMGQGIDLRDHKKYHAAIAKQKRAMALAPTDWLPHTELAYCYRQIHRADEAIKECDKAMALAPELPHINYCQAFAYRDAKQLDNMCAQFDIAIARDPEVAEYFCDYARELSAIKQNTQAFKQISQAVRLEPDNSHYRVWRAALACDLGLFKAGVEEASAAIALKKDDSAAYRQRSRAYMQLKQHTESLADAEMAVKLAPKDIMALDQRSKVLYWIDKYKECLESCNETLKIYPKNANAYIYRSFCYFRLDKPALSLADSNRAIKYRGKREAENWDFERRAAARVLLHQYNQAEADELEAARLRKAKKTEGAVTAKSLTAQESWAMACSAVLFIKNHQENDSLAGLPITPAARAEQLNKLSRDWGITNARSLKASIDRLRLGGDHVWFASMGRFVTGLNPEQYARYLESIKDQPKLLNRVKITREYYTKLGEKGILAWDLSRVINNCRFAYAAGIIDEKTAWSLIFPACKQIQSHFQNFDQVGENYLIGRKFWSEDETKATGQDIDVAVAELVHFKSSPYRKQPWDTNLDIAAPDLAESVDPQTASREKVFDFAKASPSFPLDVRRMIERLESQANFVHLPPDMQLALQKMMLGLRPAVPCFGNSLHSMCAIPQNIVAGPRVLGAYPFNSGVLLATLPRSNSPESKNIALMFADIAEKNISPVNVSGLDQISDLVVVAGRAYIAGSAQEKPMVAELTTSGIRALPLPPGIGAMHIGIGSGAPISIRGAEVCQLEGEAWRQLCVTAQPFKVGTKITPRLFEGRVYFVEDDAGTDLAWIDVKSPQIVHHLADSLLAAYRANINWKEIYDVEVCNDQLWISLGNIGQNSVLLNIDKDSEYHIARYRGESYFDQSRVFEVLHKGPLSMAGGEYQDVYFSEGGWLYRLKSPDLEYLATLTIDEKGARTEDWPLTKMLSLGDGTLFVASRAGGALLLKRGDTGYSVTSFSQQTKPVTW